jgi:hypothetical protein
MSNVMAIAPTKINLAVRAQGCYDGYIANLHYLWLRRREGNSKVAFEAARKAACKSATNFKAVRCSQGFGRAFYALSVLESGRNVWEPERGLALPDGRGLRAGTAFSAKAEMMQKPSSRTERLMGTSRDQPLFSQHSARVCPWLNYGFDNANI